MKHDLSFVGGTTNTPENILKEMSDDPTKYGNLAIAPKSPPGMVRILIHKVWIEYQDDNGVVLTLPRELFDEIAYMKNYEPKDLGVSNNGRP